MSHPLTTTARLMRFRHGRARRGETAATTLG